MSIGARVSVLIICLLLSISFFATTGVLIWEFWKDNFWLNFVAIDSHLFLFFPSFAVLSLIAFYLPASAIFDLYWKDLKFGRIRLIAGLLLVFALSWLISCFILASANKSVWNVKPGILWADRGVPAGCATRTKDCDRLPVLDAVRNLREVSQVRRSLRPFLRKCSFDHLIEPNAQSGPKRYCMVTTPYSDMPSLKTDEECCQAQRNFVRYVNNLQAPIVRRDEAPFVTFLKHPLEPILYKGETANQSLTGAVHSALLPLKIFFLLSLVFVSVLLTLHLRKIEQYYRGWLVRIETGLIIGTFAILFFPLMSQAFLESQDALVGDLGRGNFSVIIPILSFAFGSWTLLILLYFYRRADKQAEILAKIAGAAAGVVAMLQYQAIIDFLVRILGAGAHWTVIAAMAIAAFVLILGLIGFISRPQRRDVQEEETTSSSSSFIS